MNFISFKHVNSIYLSIEFKSNTIIKLNYSRELISNKKLKSKDYISIGIITLLCNIRFKHDYHIKIE
jgi:hypothetical protein